MKKLIAVSVVCITLPLTVNAKGLGQRTTKDLEEVVGREEAITGGVGWVGTGFVGKGGDGVW